MEQDFCECTTFKFYTQSIVAMASVKMEKGVKIMLLVLMASSSRFLNRSPQASQSYKAEELSTDKVPQFLNATDFFERHYENSHSIDFTTVTKKKNG